MKALITIFNQNSRITGTYPKEAFREVTSYAVEGAEFSKAFKRGGWDGRKNLGTRTGTFPTGLVPHVLQMCEENEVEVEVEDKRQEPGRMDLWGKPSYELEGGIKLRPHQLRAAQAAVAGQRGILDMVTSSGKSITFVGIVHALNVPTLVLVPSRELLYQMQKTFMEVLPGASETAIGIVGDSEWSVGSYVTIATVSTLYARLETEACQALLNSVDLLIADECHLAGSESYYEVCMSCQAFFRIAASGTPMDRGDNGTLCLYAAFGPVLAKVTYKELVEAKVLPKAKIIFDKVTSPILPKKPKLTYPQVYKQGVVENPVLKQKILDWTKICVDQGLSVLILVDQISHGESLDEALWNVDGTMISHTFIHGESSNRDEALKEFANREIPVLIGSAILDVGISIDAVDVLIMAGSRKSKIKSLQRLGRALRGEKAIVIDFYSFCHDFLLEHSKKRFMDYKEQDCFILKQSAPNADLIKKLWSDK